MSKQGKNRGRRKELISLREDVAGVDVGSREHWVCAPDDAGGDVVRVFGTTTPELKNLVAWLAECGVTSVAMESTSVYWIPLYELLEEHGIEAVLVNARQLANVPGRKTDLRDCQWLRLLHCCGLLRASFRPSNEICQLRALRRQVSNLQAARTRAIQWMQKALDQMNVQVHKAVSDVTGTTGMAIIRAIVAGERDPCSLARLRDYRCKKSEEAVAAHLEGTWREEHLFNLQMSLQHYDHLESQISHYDRKLVELLGKLVPPERADEAAPAHPNPKKEETMRRRGEIQLRDTLWRITGVDLTLIDGVSAPTALTILTEVGFDLTAFPDEHHFVSWLRLTPKTAISGGKSLTKKRAAVGATRTAAALRMSAVTVRRSKSALGAAYRRTSARKSGAVAAFSVARKIATHIYRALRFGKDYYDIGADAYERRFRDRKLKALSASARTLGLQLTPIEGAVSG